MFEKIKDEIESLEYHELKELQKEIARGSQNISKIITRKVREYEQDTGCICPVCSSIIDSSKPASFTLIFGPKNLKKKVNFCAIDCLQYFVSNLKHTAIKEADKNEISSRLV